MYEVFPDFEHECHYVQTTEHSAAERDVAREAAANEIGTAGENLALSPIWMRWVEDDEASEASWGEYDECWLTCKSEDEGATPFYRVEET